MAKPKLTPDQHIAELNRRLRQHEYYRKGMAFVPSPPNSSGRKMSGYTVTGPYGLMGVYAQVAHQVSDEFDLDV